MAPMDPGPGHSAAGRAGVRDEGVVHRRETHIAVHVHGAVGGDFEAHVFGLRAADVELHD